MENEVKLLPCPFCGGEASDKGSIHYSKTRNPNAWFADGTPVKDAYFCSCIKCGSANKGLIGFQTIKEAVEHWNTRHEATK